MQIHTYLFIKFTSKNDLYAVSGLVENGDHYSQENLESHVLMGENFQLSIKHI